MKKLRRNALSIKDMPSIDEKRRYSRRYFRYLLKTVLPTVNVAGEGDSLSGIEKEKLDVYVKAIQSVSSIKIPLTMDLTNRMHDNYVKKFARLSAVDNETVRSNLSANIDRIEMDIANDMSAMAVAEITGKPEQIQDEYCPIVGDVDIDKELYNMTEENVIRTNYIKVRSTDSAREESTIEVPYTLVTIGGTSGKGKTGIDAKLSVLSGLVGVIDHLQWMRLLAEEKVTIDDTPEYLIHRMSRHDAVCDIISKDGDDLSKFIKNPALSNISYLQTGYIHVEEPCRDASDITIPNSKGLKVLTRAMRSDFSGSTIDSLTGKFFEVSGGAMSGGWNPSESKSMLSQLDRFSNRYNHPIISVINYLKFGAEGQKGIMSICESMASMHIDLNAGLCSFRTLNGSRPVIVGDVEIVGVGVRTALRFNEATSVMNDTIADDFVEFKSSSISDQLSKICGVRFIMPPEIDNMFTCESPHDIKYIGNIIVSDDNASRMDNSDNSNIYHHDSAYIEPIYYEETRNKRSSSIGGLSGSISAMLEGKLAPNSPIGSSSRDRSDAARVSQSTDHHIISVDDLRGMDIYELKIILRNTYLRLNNGDVIGNSAEDHGRYVQQIVQVLLEKGADIDSINEVIDKKY